MGARLPRVTVAAQPAVVVPAERPKRPNASPLIPSLQRLCPGRYAPGMAYGEVLTPVRVPPSEGKLVRLGRGAGAVVGRVAVMSTPPRPTLTQLSRGASCSADGAGCSLCEPGYIVSVPEDDGPRFLAVSARQVRELNRSQREGLCPHHRRITREYLAAIAAEVERVEAHGGHPRDAAVARDLPYPHRRGSSPCCESSDATPERVLAALARWSRGERAGLTSAALVELARRAVPARSGIPEPRFLSEIPAAMAAVRDHCFAALSTRLAQATTRRADKFATLKDGLRARYNVPRPPRGGQGHK